jgi:hypothetical protein
LLLKVDRTNSDRFRRGRGCVQAANRETDADYKKC